jgi:hypothetical protein
VKISNSEDLLLLIDHSVSIHLLLAAAGAADREAARWFFSTIAAILFGKSKELSAILQAISWFRSIL